MTTTANNPKTLGALALSAAVKAVGNVDSACYDAAVALGLVLASKQLERMETGETLDSESSIKANKATFRAFLKEFSYKGNPVWRDSQHTVDGFAAMKPDTRRKAAAEYIDKKPKGSRLIDGLARLKTQSFRLMEHAITNHHATLVNLRAMKEAGADSAAQMESFKAFVAEEYGSTYAALESALSPDKKQKEKKSDVDSIVEKAEGMTLTDLAVVAERIAALYAKRVADETEVREQFSEEDSETLADETPELISAAA
jgi:predicted nucleotidyltransferase